MQSTASTPALPVLPEFRSATSAARALARVESRYSRITRRLDRESRPTCRGEFGGWDWPTLRICQPEVYAELRALGRHELKGYQAAMNYQADLMATCCEALNISESKGSAA